MIVVKVLIYIFIILLSGLIGLIIAKPIKDKYKFYCELIRFCKIYKSEISFSQKKLTNIFCDFKSNNAIFNNFFENYTIKLQNNTNKMENNYKNIFNNNELNNLLDFYNSIGKKDIYNETDMLDKYINVFLLDLETSFNRYKAKYWFYIKLAILIGFAIVIIII